MKHIDYSKGWVCPKCDKVSTQYPALSRRDNTTNICSECGGREALEDYERYKDYILYMNEDESI